MKTVSHFSKPLWLLVSAMVLAACTLVVPTWLMPLGQMRLQNHILPSQTQDTFYVISYTQGYDSGELEHFDMEGNLLTTSSLPALDSGRFLEEVIDLPGDDFYLGASAARDVVYFDPISGISWQGFGDTILGDLDKLRLESFFSTQQGELVFTGQLTENYGTPEQLFYQVLGLVDKQGTLKEFYQFPEYEELHLVQTNQGEFFLKGQYPRPVREEIGRTYEITRFDAALQGPTEVLSEIEFNLYAAAGNYLLGYTRRDSSGSKLQAIHQQTFVAQDILLEKPFAYRSKFLDGKDSFYSMIELEDGSPRVCNYNYDFEQQWCQVIEMPGRVMDIQVLADGSIGFTLYSVTDETIGVRLADEADSGYGWFEVVGRHERRFTHYIINPQGKITMNAREAVYSQQGLMLGCGYLQACPEPEVISPGICNHEDSAFLSQTQMISVVNHCENVDDGCGTLNYCEDEEFDNWTRQMVFWSK